MELNNKGKIKLSKIVVAIICLKFLYNSVRLLMKGEYLYGCIYIILTIVLAVFTNWFLKTAAKKLLILAVIAAPISLFAQKE